MFCIYEAGIFEASLPVTLLTEVNLLFETMIAACGPDSVAKCCRVHIGMFSRQPNQSLVLMEAFAK